MIRERGFAAAQCLSFFKIPSFELISRCHLQHKIFEEQPSAFFISLWPLRSETGNLNKDCKEMVNGDYEVKIFVRPGMWTRNLPSRTVFFFFLLDSSSQILPYFTTTRQVIGVIFQLATIPTPYSIIVECIIRHCHFTCFMWFLFATGMHSTVPSR